MMLTGIIAFVSLSIGTAAVAQERSLHIHFTHTKETARVVFKRNGRYVQDGLNQLNHMLRDWRRNEPAKMDPALFDLLWEVYNEVNATQPIHVVSAYRSPATNRALRSNSSGVAENSAHMRGQAIDFYIPGVPTARLRELGFRKQVGGVGYYPSSGSPFVHLDTGSVRAWPRMTQAQLQQIFPDGRTLHIPSNGRVLSQEGRRYAEAEWNRCRRVPCSAAPSGGDRGIQVASGDSGPRRTLMDLFRPGENAGAPQQQQAAQPAPAPRQPQPQPAAPQPQQPTPPVAVAAAPAPAPAEPPTPTARPEAITETMAVAEAQPQPVVPFGFVDAETLARDRAAIAATPEPEAAPAPQVLSASAPVPPMMSRQMLAMRSTTQPPAPSQDPVPNGSMAIAALDAPTPQARPNELDQSAALVLAAYAPNPGQSAPRITTTALPQTAPVPQLRPALAAVGPAAGPAADNDLSAFAALFDGPITRPGTQGAPDAATANALAALNAPAGELHAPDLGEAARMFTAPQMLASSHFAQSLAPAAAGFDPATQAGAQIAQLRRTLPAAGTGLADTIWVRLE